MEELLKRNLIAELHIDTLPAEKQEELLVRAWNIVSESILNKCLTRLSDKEKKELDAIVADGNKDASDVFSFLAAKIPDFEDIAKKEVADFKQASFDVMSKIV